MKRMLKGCSIGIELFSGEKIFGKVVNWTQDAIWIIRHGEESQTDVPRDIIVRALVVLKGVSNE
jgi:hypothetical protein